MLFMIKALGAPALTTAIFWLINARKPLSKMWFSLITVFIISYVTFATRIDIFCYITGLVILIGFWRWMNAED